MPSNDSIAKPLKRLGEDRAVGIPGLGGKTARRLWTEAGIGSLDALAIALDAGRLDVMTG